MSEHLSVSRLRQALDQGVAGDVRSRIVDHFPVVA